MLRPAVALAVASVFLCGCGNGDGGADDGSDASGAVSQKDVEIVSRARLVFATGDHFPTSIGDTGKMVNSGLFAMGDVNGDGFTDIAAGGAKYPGYFALYSGRDGSEIWRFNALIGKAAEAAGEKGFQVESFLAVDDVNSDGVPDIFFQDGWGNKRLFLVSGKDGSIIARGEAEKMTPAAASRDMTGDGVPDILCFYSTPLIAMVFSGADLSQAAVYEKPVDFGEKYIRDHMMLGRFDDVNGDGVDDLVATADQSEATIVAFLSGKDMSEIRRINIEWDRVFATRRYACGGDLNGDGIADIVKAANAGGGEIGHDSYLAAYSGADGSRIWRVEGTSIPTGVKRFSVDAKTGQRTDLPADAGFGHTAAIVPDIDGDSKPEVAVMLGSLVKGKYHNGVLIFSGATGEHIETLLHNRDDFIMAGPGSFLQIAALESADGKGSPGVAVTGRVSEKEFGIAIFLLERVD